LIALFGVNALLSAQLDVFPDFARRTCWCRPKRRDWMPPRSKRW